MAEIIGTYFKEIRNDRGLEKELAIELAIKAQQGDNNAKEILVKNHLLLVVKIAREYLNMGVSFEELIAEGNVGLMNAVEKYKASKNSSFSTCAVYWIKASIIRNCMHNNRTVRLPEHVSELQRTNRWDGAHYSQFSIDKPNENGDSFSESLPDGTPSTASIFVKEEVEMTKKKVRKFLSTLTDRESEIIRMRFGIELDEPVKLELIAEHFGLTTTRINQIIKLALKKMQGVSTVI